jgi:hypothetical protein
MNLSRKYGVYGILFSHKKEWNFVIHKMNAYMDGTEENLLKQN